MCVITTVSFIDYQILGKFLIPEYYFSSARIYQTLFILMAVLDSLSPVHFD